MVTWEAEIWQRIAHNGRQLIICTQIMYKRFLWAACDGKQIYCLGRYLFTQWFVRFMWQLHLFISLNKLNNSCKVFKSNEDVVYISIRIKSLIYFTNNKIAERNERDSKYPLILNNVSKFIFKMSYSISSSAKNLHNADVKKIH